MKFNKLLISLSLISTIPVGFITSCSKSWADDITENDHTNYIKNRTFSMLGTGYSASNRKWNVFGTAWIIADATPNSNSDYSYYFATNMHVIRGWSKLTSLTLSYSDYSQADKQQNISIDKYIEITDFNRSYIKSIDDNSNFLYEDQTQKQYLSSGIDFAYFQATLNPETMPQAIKSKLDSLNEFKSQNNYICKFKQIVENSDSNDKKKYVGGYPYISSASSTKWECHSLATNELVYKPLNTIYAKPDIGHSIGYPDKDQEGNNIAYEESSITPEQYYRYDVSPQYVSKANRTNEYLAAGASGSMLIDEDYNTIGIYWGGWQLGNDYYPCYSLFNTPTKNFLPSII